LARDTGAPYTANWNLRKAPKGPHIIRARAIDRDTPPAANEQSISVTTN